MLDREFLRKKPEKIRSACEAKNEPCEINKWIELDQRRRAILAEVELLRNRLNKSSKEVARLKKTGEDTSSLIEKNREISGRIQNLDTELKAIDSLLVELGLTFPNIPDPDVPIGKDAASNKIVRHWGEKPEFDFKPQNHLNLLGGLFDQNAAALISGSNFILLRGNLARLQRKLISWMLEYHKQAGYEEIWPPFVALKESMQTTAQLPKLAEDMFAINDDNLYLVPTGEVPLTNIYRGKILNENELPVKLAGYTPCFRREAGSYGRETRGLNRVHQFEKVEIVHLETPDRSAEVLEEMTAYIEKMLQALELPYRVALLASGDLSFAASRCFDLEIWAAGQEKWLEISSVSNFRDFQARRGMIRYKPSGGGKPKFVHTLNGSGLALPRLIIALVENNQMNDGRIKLPAVIADFMDQEFLE